MYIAINISDPDSKGVPPLPLKSDIIYVCSRDTNSNTLYLRVHSLMWNLFESRKTKLLITFIHTIGINTPQGTKVTKENKNFGSNLGS